MWGVGVWGVGRGCVCVELLPQKTFKNRFDGMERSIKKVVTKELHEKTQ